MSNRLHTKKIFSLTLPGCSWSADGDLWQGGIVQQAGRNLLHVANLLIILLAAFALSSCNMVSNEMLPGIEYREIPHVEIIEYDDHVKL